MMTPYYRYTVQPSYLYIRICIVGSVFTAGEIYRYVFSKHRTTRTKWKSAGGSGPRNPINHRTASAISWTSTVARRGGFVRSWTRL